MDYRIGDIVTGRITGIQPYGAFVALDEQEQGLIHISECQHGFVKGIHEIFHLGQTVQVVILDIDEYSHRISLSIRALTPPPALSPRRRRKHYWTTRKAHAGFAPIAERLPGWVEDFTKHEA